MIGTEMLKWFGGELNYYQGYKDSERPQVRMPLSSGQTPFGPVVCTWASEKKTELSALRFLAFVKAERTCFPVSSLHNPMARASTPTTPAMLATTAPVGAGAPPVEVEPEEPMAEEDAASSRALTEALMELRPAVRDESTEDSGRLLVTLPALLM